MGPTRDCPVNVSSRRFAFGLVVIVLFLSGSYNIAAYFLVPKHTFKMKSVNDASLAYDLDNIEPRFYIVKFDFTFFSYFCTAVA